MKKTSKIKWIAIPLALVLVLALSVMGFSALMAPQNPKVMLDGNAKDFVISGTDKKAANGNADLFPDMKNLMPGDSVTQKITVGVKNFSALDVKNVTIFMKADNPQGDYNFLKDSRYVTFTVKHGSETISANLGEEISLGLFNTNGTTDLTMTVTIDKAAGNELQGKLGSIDWIFYTKTGPVLNKKDHLAYIIGYPDGTVRPERQITRAEVATIFFRLLTDESRNEYKSKTNNFSDVNSGDWYNNAVSTLCNAEILNGYPDGTFKPNNPITRAEIATIAAKFDAFTQEDIDVTKSFSDIKGHWAEQYILRAASRGWVNGYPDGTFHPNDNIKRNEAMTLVNNVLERVVDLEGLKPIEGSAYYNVWSDNSDKNAWFYCAVQEATNSHKCYRVEEKPSPSLPGVYIEEWYVVEKAPDWAALEKTW